MVLIFILQDVFYIDSRFKAIHFPEPIKKVFIVKFNNDSMKREFKIAIKAEHLN